MFFLTRKEIDTPGKHSEKYLLERLAFGDEKLFEEIYDLHWENLYIAAYKRLKSPEIAEDTVQQIFIDLWEKRKTLAISKSLSAYLHGCLKRKVLLHYRTLLAHESHLKIIKSGISESDDSMEKRILQKDLLNKVDGLVLALPDRPRDIFTLSRKEFLTNEQIADKLAISTKTVEYHISYALKYLRKNLKFYTHLLLIFLLQ